MAVKLIFYPLIVNEVMKRVHKVPSNVLSNYLSCRQLYRRNCRNIHLLRVSVPYAAVVVSNAKQN
jgi:hypothetical protein